MTYSNYFLIQDKKQLSNVLYHAALNDTVINENQLNNNNNNKK